MGENLHRREIAPGIRQWVILERTDMNRPLLQAMLGRSGMVQRQSHAIRSREHKGVKPKQDVAVAHVRVELY